MPYADQREYIERLEAVGELKRIEAEVDWNLELGAIMRRANDLRQPALLFENIKGYPPNTRVFGNIIGASQPNPFKRVCHVLELPPETPGTEIIEELARRIDQPVKPVTVSDAPCKENVIKGDDVDLLKFPVPYLRELDGGRYFGTWHTDVTRDPDSGWVNWGMYRHMLIDRGSIGWLANPGQHGPGLYYRKHEAKEEAMPMSIAIGTDPAIALASITQVPSYVNEAEVAGGIRGEPVKLIRCETNDLMVPAGAEIILEGEVRPRERALEGPFGEYTGYASSDKAPRPVFHVNCITHRNNPIFPVSTPGKPLDDTTFTYAICGSAALTLELRKMGLPFKALYLTNSAMSIIISTDEVYPGYIHVLSSAIWGSKLGIYRPVIIVVGEDVDVTNSDEVLWAMTTRMHPERDIHIKKRVPGSPLFPFLSPEERTNLTAAAVCFDATFPCEWKETAPKTVDFEHSWSTETKELVRSRWKEYGFE